MCDCGDPDSLYTFCHEHSGPFTDQKQIDEYINKVFPGNILKNLKNFFDDFFMQFTKYLILTEKCKFFYENIFADNIPEKDNKQIVLLIKDNFSIIFQNFLNFIRKITEKNMAMIHLIASYLLKNNYNEKVVTTKDKEQFITTHNCIKINNNSIDILYKDKNENKNIFSFDNSSKVEKHICQCPFLRLIISNYRSNIGSNEQNETDNLKLFLSFTNNLFLRSSMCIIFFFLYKEVIFNSSPEIMNLRNQFFIENALAKIAQQSNLIENTYEFLYEYLQNYFEKNINNFNLGIINDDILEYMIDYIRIYMFDSQYITKPKVRKLICPKILIHKKLIDILGLFHNKINFKSIVPHPVFQAKKQIIKLVDMELFIIFTANMILLCNDWKNIDKLKEICNYFVDKILYLDKNSKLEKNEYSYHISIYRYFGAFMNSFCFNYALNNNTNINEAIEFMKKNLFPSKKDLNKIILIILEEYYKFFGFIIGIKTGYFNYYEISNYNYIYFNDLRYLIKDLILLKYIFVLSDEPIKLNTLLEKSNIENVYSIFKSIFIENMNETTEQKSGFINFFKHPILTLQNTFSKKENDKITLNEKENNFAFQWKQLLEMIIIILKNDTVPLTEIFVFYKESVSLITMNYLFDKVKKNKYLMQDCRYILKQTIIQKIIANGNFMDLEHIKKVIYDFYFNIFDEKEFDEILNEVAAYKINGEKKEFYIKDSVLKFLDINYYYSNKEKSKSQIYLSDFKKDVFKLYNSYYYHPSEFCFDFYNKVYEKVFLCVDNITLLMNILEILLNPTYEKKMKNYNPGSIRTIMLPVVLNYLSIFGCINSKGFYEFKLKNENIITKICNILNDFIKANKENKFIDSELAENIMELINQLNSYKIIKEYIKDNKININDKSYHADIEYLNQNLDIKNKNLEKLESKELENKTKIKSMKDKLKNKMKIKSNKFLDKALNNKTLKNFMETKDKNDEILSIDDNEEIMCFYCRNTIYLKKFDTPYGKLGYLIEDYFYHNSLISTLNSELSQISEKNNNLNKDSFTKFINKSRNDLKQKHYRMISCGHYFHKSCFEKSNSLNNFKCPLCEKLHNILIPPLINFYNRDNFLKPQLKAKDIFDNKKFKYDNIIIKQEFQKIVFDFIEENIKLSSENSSDKIHIFEYYLKNLFQKFQSYFNYLINLLYCDAITFHKQQQIDIIKNFILSFRYLIYIKSINFNEIIAYIHNLINKFEINNIKTDFRPYDVGYYYNLFDELLFCFSILLDYDEIKNIFIYLINIILPYFCFFIYLRDLVINNDLFCLDNTNNNLIEKITLDKINNFLNENNLDIINYFKKFLHKLYIVKIITNFNDIEYKENNNIKNLSIEQLFILLNMENLYNSLSKNDKNEIIFSDLFNKIPEQLSKYDYYNKNMFINFDELMNMMINKINEIKVEKSIIKPEFIIQFNPYEFKLISLDNQIFDFFEKYIMKKCIICNKNNIYYFICLICGEKICSLNICSQYDEHVKSCGGERGVFVYINDMKLYHINYRKELKKSLPLFVNEFGDGPSETNKGREFILSKENYNKALKDFVSFDIKI